MKTTMLATALLSIIGVGHARADEAKAATEPSFNAALTSDYRYRGISQTRLQPALQGGADLVHGASGFYAGAWASTIKWTGDAGGGASVELDIFAGKRGELAPGVGYDAGVLTYVYPSNGLRHVPGFASANTTEVYGQLSYGPASLKYSHSLTNLFGFVESKHSGYLDLGANLVLGQGAVLNLHAGRQRVAHNAAASYTDWKVGLTRDFGLVTGALAYVATNAGKSAYASPANGKFLGKSAWVLSVSKPF